MPDFGGDEDDEPPAKVETHADEDAKALEEESCQRQRGDLESHDVAVGAATAPDTGLVGQG